MTVCKLGNVFWGIAPTQNYCRCCGAVLPQRKKWFCGRAECQQCNADLKHLQHNYYIRTYMRAHPEKRARYNARRRQVRHYDPVYYATHREQVNAKNRRYYYRKRAALLARQEASPG
jgi:hypothetical protein